MAASRTFKISVPESTLIALLDHFGQDPVTAGWCLNATEKEGTVIGMRFTEIGDAPEDKDIKHTLTARKIRWGLQVMADRYPHHLERVLDLDQQDMASADLFVQCCLFGEEKYA